MVALRLIPCLDVANGRVVKGVNFVNLRDSGDPVELACRYSDEGADELVFLDIRASLENRNTLVELVSRTAKSVKIPFTVGGGIVSHDFPGGDTWRIRDGATSRVIIDTGFRITSSTNIGVFGSAAVAKQTVTGSKGGNAALDSLLTALENYGWVLDNST